MKSVITAVLTTGLLVSPVCGGPLKKRWVSADASWLVHVDIEALNDSTLGSAILEQAEELDLELDDLDEFERETGIDPRTDLMSITLYGMTGDLDEDAVAIAVTNENADIAVERLEDEEDVTRIELDGNTVYVIPDGGDRCFVHVRRGRRDDQRVVVLSQDKQFLGHALEVLDDRERSLSRGKSRIMGSRPRRGSILFVAAGDVADLPDLEPASEILRLAKGFTIDLGEMDEELRGEMTVFADDEEVATNIADVVQGMVALGHLLANEDPQLKQWRRLLTALDVEAEDGAITVRFRYDSHKLLDDLGVID